MFRFFALFVMICPAAQADVGQLHYNNHCRTCHSLKEGDHRLGPSLFQVMGRAAGTSVGYRYSSALGSSDLIWDQGTMDAFLADPDVVVPGNNMNPFQSIADPELRRAIIDWLSVER